MSAQTWQVNTVYCCATELLPTRTAGLKAKYGLAERPLLLSAEGISKPPPTRADATCVIQQETDEQAAYPKQADKQIIQRPDSDVQVKLLSAGSIKEPQEDAPAVSEVPALAGDTGAASNAQMQPPTATLPPADDQHSADSQPSSRAEDTASDLSERVASGLAETVMQQPPPGAPHWRQLSETLSRNGFRPLTQEVSAQSLLSVSGL